LVVRTKIQLEEAEEYADKLEQQLEEATKLIELLQNDHSSSVTIHSSQLKHLKTQSIRYRNYHL